ncbi:MAG: DUF2470 domain-containing protein [Acidimicrobiia bacterium]
MPDDIPQPFGPDVVAAVARHMNDDHAEDNVLIVRALGAVPDATAATMTGMDGAAIEFEAVVEGRAVPVRIPWSHPLTERAEVRGEVARMYQDACRQLGLPARH